MLQFVVGSISIMAALIRQIPCKLTSEIFISGREVGGPETMIPQWQHFSVQTINTNQITEGDATFEVPAWKYF